MIVPTAAEIFVKPPVLGPWSAPQHVLSLVVEALPVLRDDLAVDLVELLAIALVDRDAQLRAVRAVLSPALELATLQHVQILRLRLRLADLLDGRRERLA